MGRDRLGEFEQLVLLACLRLGSDAYTVSVADEIEARTGRGVVHAAVYVALRRLEDKGLVTSALGDGTPERGGRPKRFFQALPAATDVLRDSRDELLSMWRGLDALDPTVEG